MPPPNHTPVSAFRAAIHESLQRVRDGEDLVLTRYGQKQAVVMSAERYEALVAAVGDAGARRGLPAPPH